MLPDLKEWEANLPEGAPKLLVVSAETEEANEAMELSSPVVLDQRFSIGRAFGAGVTPSVVLIDEEGKISSEVAVGAPAVLGLSQRAREAENRRRRARYSLMFELFQPTHLLFVLVVALIVFGPKRLMEISRSLGQTIRSLQEYKEEFKEELLTTSPKEQDSDSKKEERTANKNTRAPTHRES